MHYEKYNITDEECVFIPIPQSYRDCLTLINSDLCRLGKQKRSQLSVLIHILTHPLSFLVWFRLCAYKGIFYIPAKLMLRLCSFIHKIDIQSGTKIGYGLYLGHKMCMVVSHQTIIGNNVNLSQFLNIGTNHNTPAIIGDRVYIGPGVCIVEDVRIGAEATVGAGAVVSKSLPAGSTSVGCPARVVNYNKPGRYISNPYSFTVPQ